MTAPQSSSARTKSDEAFQNTDYSTGGAWTGLSCLVPPVFPPDGSCLRLRRLDDQIFFVKNVKMLRRKEDQGSPATEKEKKSPLLLQFTIKDENSLRQCPNFCPIRKLQPNHLLPCWGNLASKLGQERATYWTSSNSPSFLSRFGSHRALSPPPETPCLQRSCSPAARILSAPRRLGPVAVHRPFLTASPHGSLLSCLSLTCAVASMTLLLPSLFFSFSFSPLVRCISSPHFCQFFFFFLQHNRSI